VADAGGCGVVVAPRGNRGWLALALGLGLAAVLRRKRAR
jgi:MYXO-CTERM domain-containing protein